MTQSELARVTGIDQPMISFTELGNGIPLLSTFFILCAGLCIDPGKVIKANFPVAEPVRRPRRRRAPTNARAPAPAPRLARVLEPTGAD